MNRLILAMVLGLVSSAISAAAVPEYRFLREIPIGGENGWDYVTVDATAHRLYLAQSTRVVVVDLAAGRVAGEVTGIEGAHGFAIAPELGRGFASGGKENKVSIVDLKTLKTLQKVPTGDKPDAIVYVPETKEVYAFNGESQSATIIQGETGKVVATLPLPGGPEFAVLDASAHRIYLNLEDRGQVAAIDVRLRKVVSAWSIAPVESPSGLALDSKRHRVFSVGRNGKIAMSDAVAGKLVATAAIGQRPDGASFDPGNDLVFSSNGEGSLTILHEGAGSELSAVQTLKTEKGARTMAIDPGNHRVYLPSARFETANLKPGARPRVIAGSLKVLIYGPAP